jgi:glycosyltransferase involved in cell wall biosynthesis
VKTMSLRVGAFTGGDRVPSGRFRVGQYIAPLRAMNVELLEFSCRVGKYPPVTRWIRSAWAAALLAEQMINVAKSYSFDVCLLQREILSTYATLEGFTKKPRVLDIDDAIFVQRGGRAAQKLARLTDQVICGNNYLAEWFRRLNPRITVIPTPVDTERFVPAPPRVDGPRRKVIGWVGTSGNLHQLHTVERALRKVLLARKNTVLRIVSDREPTFSQLPRDRVEFVRWSEAREVENIQEMDVGIMPLEDNAWTRGKCSFKMLQYMACGLPVVVSPVGMNSEVLAKGNIGVGATSESQWVEGLTAFVDSETVSADCGLAGRRVVSQFFAVDVLAQDFCRVLRTVV